MSDTIAHPTAPLVKLEEVEWRLDSEAYQRGGGREYVARWVPYLDATKVARLMDDWVGPARWRIDRYWVPEWTTSGLMCQVSVKFGDEWVPRADIGELMGGIHQAKGSVSDAFKRTACRSWGAGRNVYDLPTLYAPCRVKFGKDGQPERDGKGKIRAFGSTDDTERDLVNQLRSLGYGDPTARISMVTEGADPHGEGPQRVIIPDDDPTPTVAAPAQTPSAPVNTVSAMDTAEPVSEPASGANSHESEDVWDGPSLPELMGQFSRVPPELMVDLRKAGYWPIGKVTDPHAKKLARHMIQTHLDRQTENA